jgi:hypothetical protein
MSGLESEDQRLSLALRRLMQVNPPLLAPAQPRAQHWLGAVVASVAALVVVAGVVGGSIVLRGRLSPGNPPITAASPSVRVLPYRSANPIVEIEELPTWMTVCLHSAGIVPTPPAPGVQPSLTAEQVVADARSADYRVGSTVAPVFLQFSAPPFAFQTAANESLAQPVWAVGITDIRFVYPSPAPHPPSGSMIFFVSDPSGAVPLELGCSQS